MSLISVSHDGVFEESDYRAKHLRDQAQSGLSVVDYCRRQRLCTATFYYWRKLCRTHMKQRQQTDVVSFREIGRVNSIAPAQWTAEVELRSGTVVRVNTAADPRLLSRVLELLD